MLVVLMLACIIPFCYCSTCPSFTSNSYTITSEECSFTGSSTTSAYKVVFGPVSHSLYYLYYLGTPNSCAIRKINQDGSLAWMAALSFNPIIKSLIFDSSEQYVYVASFTNPVDVVRLSSSTGSIIDQRRHTSLNGQQHDNRIYPLTDGSGYYVFGRDTSNIATICKYLFSSPLTSSWQQISNFQWYSYGQLKISDNTFFVLGFDPVSPGNLHLYKHTFGNTSPDWSLTMACPGTGCSVTISESLLISTSIYSFINYGNPKYIYLAVISLSDGSVSSRYKSSLSCTFNVYGSGVKGDSIAALIYCPNLTYLLIFNRVTNIFTIKTYSAMFIYAICLETISNKIVIAGVKNTNNGFTHNRKNKQYAK